MQTEDLSYLFVKTDNVIIDILEKECMIRAHENMDLKNVLMRVWDVLLSVVVTSSCALSDLIWKNKQTLCSVRNLRNVMMRRLISIHKVPT